MVFVGINAEMKIELTLQRELNFQGPRASKIFTVSAIRFNIFWERSPTLFVVNFYGFWVHFGVLEVPYGSPSCPKGGNRIYLISPVEPPRPQDASRRRPNESQSVQNDPHNAPKGSK